MAAIRAAYSDLKLVKTRKVVQLIFEVPIEEADHAYKVLGGYPRPDAETWVGIAPITEEAATRAAPTADKPSRRMSDLSRAQQAGILCNDERFQAFVASYYEWPPGDVGDAAELASFVRNFCKVTSRAQLDSEPDRGKMWDQLRAEYDAWRGAIGRPDEKSAQ